MTSKKRKRLIVCAAIKFNGTIITGIRHYDKIMRMALTKDVLKEHKLCRLRGEVIQGFVDNFGSFVDRKEALKIVKENNQKLTPDYDGTDSKLYSEDIY